MAGDLERARDAYMRQSWLEAYGGFARADAEFELGAADLELESTAALMLGRDDEAVAILEHAHRRFLEAGEALRAVHAATWIGMNLAYRGAVGPATGWLSRAQRILDDHSEETAERGYLMLSLVFRHEATGEYEAGAAVAREAAAVGRRFGDRDLFALAIHAEGHLLVRAGDVERGLALLDEAMVTATSGELSPFVVGIVYCGVILACQGGFEGGRVRGWTQGV